VREGGHSFGFAFEARQRLRIVRQALGQNLNGHVPVEP
jgi:hypothetical protein